MGGEVGRITQSIKPAFSFPSFGVADVLFGCEQKQSTGPPHCQAWEHLLHSPGAQRGEQSQEQPCSHAEFLWFAPRAAQERDWESLLVMLGCSQRSRSCGLCSPLLQKGKAGSKLYKQWAAAWGKTRAMISSFSQGKPFCLSPALQSCVREAGTADVRWCQLVV